MTIDGQLRTGVNDTELTRRALHVVLDKTTDMADDVLKVPLHYYRDPKITEIEESQILRRTPLAVLPSAQVAAPNDYVVRSVLGDSSYHARQGRRESRLPELLPPPRGDARLRFRQRHPIHVPVPRMDVQERRQTVHGPRQRGFHRNGQVRLRTGRAAQSGTPRLHLGGAQCRRRHRRRRTPRRPRTDLAALDYPSFGYHDYREFESEVSWKGALEAFAESYHFPFVHGESLIGQNALANTSIHDRYGKHHRMGFPFNWITNLDSDPNGSWDVRDNMGVIYWIYPNLVLANSSVASKSSTSCPPGHPLDAPYDTVGWHVCPPPTTKRGPATTRSSTLSTPRCAMKTSPCCRNAAKVSATASTTI